MSRYTIIGCLLVAACAVMEPPEGGPEDKTPPRVVATVPRADSARVARAVKPIITFSERVDAESFKNRVVVFPPVPFDAFKVRGESLEITFGSLLPETTVCIFVKAGFKDNHLVPSTASYALYFTTADSLERGEISGVTLFKGKPDSTCLAELFEVRGDSAIDFRKAKPSRVAAAGEGGRFSFRALPTNDVRYLLWAFTDRDGDGHFSGATEFDASYGDTLILTREMASIADITVKIIDPNEPGSIAGRVVNETPFRKNPTVKLVPLLKGERPRAVTADSTGNFLVGALRPGPYQLSAFIDVKPDTLCGTYAEPSDTTKTLPEPCVTLPDTLVVKPGEARTLEPFTLK